MGALSAPPPCSPAASTLSSPPLPINSLSFSKSPPSLASPSLSVSASVSLSDLLRPKPPPPHGGIVPTIEVVKHKPLSLSHKEAALHVEGAVLLFVLVHMYPLRTGYKKLRVLIINKDVRKCLARKNGNKIIIWSWNNPRLYFSPH